MRPARRSVAKLRPTVSSQDLPKIIFGAARRHGAQLRCSSTRLISARRAVALFLVFLLADHGVGKKSPAESGAKFRIGLPVGSSRHRPRERSARCGGCHEGKARICWACALALTTPRAALVVS